MCVLAPNCEVRALTGCSAWRLAATHLAALLRDDPALLFQLAKAYLECLDLLPAARGATQHMSSLRRALLALLASPGSGSTAPGASRLGPLGQAMVVAGTAQQE